MSFFQTALKLFLKPKPPKAFPTIHDFDAFFAEVMEPCIQIIGGGTGTSSFFPVPEVPIDFVWPMHGKRAMTLVFDLDLRELAQIHSFDWLPEEGRMLFFHNVEDEECDFDTCAEVIFIAPGTSMERRPQHRHEKFQSQNVRFVPFMSVPGSEHHRAVKVPDEDAEGYWDWRIERNKSGHQIGGFSIPVQGEMPPELEAMRRNIELKTQADWDSIAQKSEGWRLLLQVDTDEEHGTCWGDAGMLYFWIHEDDARAGDFSKFKFIMQFC